MARSAMQCKWGSASLRLNSARRLQLSQTRAVSAEAPISLWLNSLSLCVPGTEARKASSGSRTHDTSPGKGG